MIALPGCLPWPLSSTPYNASGGSDVGPRLNFSFDLGAMHHPARFVIKRVAAVHGRAIVPDHKVTDTPAVLISELRRIDKLPELIEQRLRLGRRQTFDVGIAAAAEIKRRLAGIGMHAHGRMPSARRLVRIVGRRHALAHIAAAVEGSVVFDAARTQLHL